MATTILQPGSKIKHYTLEAPIGSGASGEVWKATDGSRTVAIKFMNEHLLTAKTAAKHRQRLQREVQALEMLHHAHIPALYDYDLEGKRPYLVMQYIDSPSHEHLIASGDMLLIPIPTRLKVIEVLADALSAAHAAGVIHRDVKPGNLHGIEHPYLIDFSIALPEQSIHETIYEVGTNIYMPLDSDPPDAMSDIYGFGLSAYEILFGEHALFPLHDTARTKGSYARLEAFTRLKNRQWSLPSRIHPAQLPPGLKGADFARLDAIFEKVLAPRKSRYADLPTFVNDLCAAIVRPQNADYLHLVPVSAVPQSIPAEGNFTDLEVQKARRRTNLDAERRRRRWLFVLAVAALLVIAALVVLARR